MMEFTVNGVDHESIELTVPLPADGIGCRLHIVIRANLREDRSGWNASLNIQHNVRGDWVALSKVTFDPSVLDESRRWDSHDLAWDAVEKYLLRWRKAFAAWTPERNAAGSIAFDAVLEDFRAHRGTGTPLDQDLPDPREEM